MCFAVETLNNGNGLLHSPPQNHQQQRSNTATSPGASSGSTADQNIQITQPISAPSSPLASPSTCSTTFCLPSSSAAAVGVATAASAASAATTTPNSGSASYVCTSGSNSSYAAVGASNAIDTADPNWQASKATVLERNAAMFNNELLSDVKFIVGSDFGRSYFSVKFVNLNLLSYCNLIDFDPIQTIPAHKYILATGSSVFYAMFYGGLAENKQEIKVPDVEPTAFLTLLR